MDANNYETMGQKPPRIVIQIINFHNIPSLQKTKGEIKYIYYIGINNPSTSCDKKGSSL